MPDVATATTTPGEAVVVFPPLAGDGCATDRATAIIEASLNAIITIDRAGTIVEYNPAAERLFGWRREEALGHPLDAFMVPSEFKGAARREIDHFLATGEERVLNQPIELPARRKDGTELLVELTSVPLLHDGRHEFTGFVRDVTELRRTQERLKASQARYRAIVQHSNRVLMVSGPTGREAATFLSGEDILGHQPQATLPGGFLSVVHPDDLVLAEAFIAAVHAGTQSPRSGVDIRLRHHDGAYRVCEVIGEDLTSHPTVRAMLIRASDVTRAREREHQLDVSRAQMRALIDHLGSAVLLEDETRHIRVTNDAFVEMFDMQAAPDDLVGVDCSNAADYIKHLFADPEAFAHGVEHRLADAVPVIGEVLPMTDGSTLERDYLPIDIAGLPAGHLWVYRDITQQIVERQLLTDQNRSLAELAALKNEYIATVSHELRTPLTSVVSFAELLGDHDLGELTEEQAYYLDIIDRNSKRLLRLIEDLLLMAKLESNTLPLSLGRVDLPDITHQVVAELNPRAQDKGIALRVSSSTGPRVTADSVRLQQVISNLVGNAINYTPSSGLIQVSVTPEHEAREWVLEVSDTGLGIHPDEVPHVFDAFYRASSAAAGQGGTGLGLSISRLIIEQHHGSIAVDSTPGHGTTMTVRLPFEED